VLLAEGGEDEVGVRDGNEGSLSLRALAFALAPDAAGADGDFGLEDLVAGAVGVVAGVREAGETGFLVGLEEFVAAPGAGDEHKAGGRENERLPPVDAAEKEAGDEDGRVGEGRSHVGLHEDQQHGNADEGEGFSNVLPGEVAAAEVGEVARDGEDEDELDPLGG
jgi:hypothetical protein